MRKMQTVGAHSPGTATKHYVFKGIQDDVDLANRLVEEIIKDLVPWPADVDAKQLISQISHDPKINLRYAPKGHKGFGFHDRCRRGYRGDRDQPPPTVPLLLQKGDKNKIYFTLGLTCFGFVVAFSQRSLIVAFPKYYLPH